jgi:beta-glucosidase
MFGDPALNKNRIQEAVHIAEKSDLIILALGGNEQTAREAWEGHLGDRNDLDLAGNQDELAKAMVALNKPVVVFLTHGRPNSINYIAESVPAILEGWYLGQETGTAVADVLFGDYNPGGKLPISVPRSAGQLPDCLAAVSVRLGVELFNLQVREPLCIAGLHRNGRQGQGHGRGHKRKRRARG